ncbi:hypothetical protein [Tomitella cavernea]|uniref:hypothetical protein n=1 Tax=Tomitella cavernea TaxID=1387982 RepID=UPI001906AB8F|nr:hypothetical protein [Tomitella cavernea]
MQNVPAVRVQAVDHVVRIDPQLAARVGAGLGIEVDGGQGRAPATAETSPALSRRRVRATAGSMAGRWRFWWRTGPTPVPSSS